MKKPDGLMALDHPPEREYDGACASALRSLAMTAYRRLDVTEVGDVTVVRFRDHKIIEDINIQELGQEMFAWSRPTAATSCCWISPRSSFCRARPWAS